MKMKDITVLLPIHKVEETDVSLIRKAVESFNKNKETYKNGELFLKIICPADAKNHIDEILKGQEFDFVINEGDTDFCSQINRGFDEVKTEHFSILEYDDEYAPNWFAMAEKYYFGNESVSIFLPFNCQYDENKTMWQYCNEIVWANSFSNELGFIDFECLENCSTFNLTGGIFNSEDFRAMGGFKPSIQIAFNYELLLRYTNKDLKVMVIPKEGYYHLMNRKNSLTEHYLNNIDRGDIQKWFELAKREYKFTEDRQKGIVSVEEELK